MRMKETASRYVQGLESIARDMERICEDQGYEIMAIQDRNTGLPERFNPNYIQYTKGLRARNWPEITTRHHKPIVVGEMIITAIVSEWIRQGEIIIDPHIYPINVSGTIRLQMKPFTHPDRLLFTGVEIDYPILAVDLDYTHISPYTQDKST